MKSYAKVNIFLKIVGKRGNYHEIISRFMLIKNYFDEIHFTPSRSESFKIVGNFSCDLEQNTIYKAYKELLEYTKNPDISEFFKYNIVEVTKIIPEGSGLGGGSSNAATFLKMINENLNLNLSKEELAKIGSKVGSDVAFFIYDFDSANVSGVGEIVKCFEEEPLQLNIITPKIHCDTKKVYKEFKEKFYKEAKKEEFENLKSLEIFEKYSIEEANDLYLPAIRLYPKLKEYTKDGFLFSGSGSSFFKLV